MARTKDPHAATVKAWKTRARNRKANMEATATALKVAEAEFTQAQNRIMGGMSRPGDDDLIISAGTRMGDLARTLQRHRDALSHQSDAPMLPVGWKGGVGRAANLKVGDRVVSVAGMAGTVVNAREKVARNDNHVTVLWENGVKGTANAMNLTMADGPDIPPPTKAQDSGGGEVRESKGDWHVQKEPGGRAKPGRRTTR